MGFGFRSAGDICEQVKVSYLHLFQNIPAGGKPHEVPESVRATRAQLDQTTSVERAAEAQERERGEDRDEYDEGGHGLGYTRIVRAFQHDRPDQP